MKKKTTQKLVTEQILGWGAIAGAVLETAAPAILAIDLATAGGLASFGVLMVTGGADRALNAAAKFLEGLRS